MSHHPKRPSPPVLVVRNRPGRTPRGVVAAVLAIALASAAMVVRVALPDWRGLAQELGRGLNAVLARPAGEPAKPVALAKATPAPQEKAGPNAKDPAPKPPRPAPVAEARPDAWDEIKKASEKVAAERAEAERQKAEAERKIAEAPPPPPVPGGRWRRVDPADLAAIQRRQDAMMRRMQAMMERDFERMIRDQEAMRQRFFGDMAERFGPGLPPGMDPFPPLPGMGRFAAPLPGMDRFVPPRPVPGPPDARQGRKRTGKGRNENADPSRWGV